MPATSASLPAELIDALAQEARARRRSPNAMLREWLAELAEERQAQKALEAARKANKGKPSIAAENLYRECGL